MNDAIRLSSHILLSLPCSVPEDDPSGKSAILSREEFFRIRQASKVLNKQEREYLFDAQRKDKENSQV